MDKKLLKFTILSFAFALAFLFAAPRGTMAASENFNEDFVGTDILLAVDEAHNQIRLADKDRGLAPDFEFETRGLQGGWAEER
jgi:hypothetical protein